MPTIYPPLAEAYFLALHYLTPVSAGSTPVQAAAGACAVLVTLVLLAGLRWLGRDLRWAALWAWCPTVALEAGNNAHVDVVAVLLAAVALLILARPNGGRGGALLGGALLGLAIATKVTPVLAGPAVLRRRWWWAVIAAAGSAIAAVYLPHVLAVGSRVAGFLPGYLQQEGYNSGQRFAIIGLFTSGRSAIVIAVAVLAVTGLAVLCFSDPDHPWRGAVAMTGVALAVTTPDYQWYAILLVMLVVLDGRPEWLAFAAGGYLAAEPHLGRWRVIHHSQAVGYGLAAYAAYNAYWVKRGWSEQAEVKTESRIDTPMTGKALPAGPVVVAGVAWAQRKGVARVEVGVWHEATLATQDTIDTWRQWYHRWEATPGAHKIQVRATDQTGYTQTAVVHGAEPNGATGYHTIQVSVA